jgi:hypothetical protein
MAEIHSLKNKLKIPLNTFVIRRLFFIFMIVALSFYEASSQDYFQQEVNYNIMFRSTIHFMNSMHSEKWNTSTILPIRFILSGFICGRMPTQTTTPS